MIPIDLKRQGGPGHRRRRQRGFAWSIAKALKAAGARLVFASIRAWSTSSAISSNAIWTTNPAVLPFGAGELKVEKVMPATSATTPWPTSMRKRATTSASRKHGDYTIQGLTTRLAKEFGGIDILIHSVAFSPEIKNKVIDTSRKAYLTALSISSFSLTALLKALQPYMENRPGGASAVGLTYLGGDRVVPHYGGGMSTAKAALQIDAKQLASNLGPKNIRVNIISAGPYASRAATAIGDIDEMIEHAAACSPLPRGIAAEEVANTDGVPVQPAGVGDHRPVLYVDCGYNVMGIFPKG